METTLFMKTVDLKSNNENIEFCGDIYIYLYMCVCVCVCVYADEWFILTVT